VGCVTTRVVHKCQFELKYLIDMGVLHAPK
jgi:hypothetical protein